MSDAPAKIDDAVILTSITRDPQLIVDAMEKAAGRWKRERRYTPEHIEAVWSTPLTSLRDASRRVTRGERKDYRC